MGNKKGVSTVVITMILVLLSLAAIGIVWVVVTNILEGGAGDIGNAGYDLIYTSGTTSEPKGVAITHSMIEFTTKNIVKILKLFLNPRTRWQVHCITPNKKI